MPFDPRKQYVRKNGYSISYIRNHTKRITTLSAFCTNGKRLPGNGESFRFTNQARARAYELGYLKEVRQ